MWRQKDRLDRIGVGQSLDHTIFSVEVAAMRYGLSKIEPSHSICRISVNRCHPRINAAQLNTLWNPQAVLHGLGLPPLDQLTLPSVPSVIKPSSKRSTLCEVILYHEETVLWQTKIIDMYPSKVFLVPSRGTLQVKKIVL